MNYRILKQGETILPGDEWLDNRDNEWKSRSSPHEEILHRSHLPHRRKVEYPEHTPPAPPEGMKWEYRGMGWSSEGRPTTYYYLGGNIDPLKPMIGDNTPASGLLGLQYFEAVPDVGVEKFYEKMDEIANTASQVLAENPKEAQGRKKCPMHLLPPEFLIQTANVLGHGAAKYNPWNWRTAPIKLSTYLAAIYRHTTAFADGEDIDESGFPHAAHIAASCAIIIDAMKHGTLVDDRPTTNHDTTI